MHPSGALQLGSPQAVSASGRLQRVYDRFKLDPLLYALFAAMFTVVWRVQDFYGVFGVLHVGLLTPLAALVLFLVDRDRRRDLSAIRSPIATLTVILLGLMCASVPFALYPGLAFRFVTQDYIPNFVVMVLIAASIRGTIDAERFAFVQVLGCAMFCVIVITRFKVGADGRLGDLAYYDANDFAMLIVCTLPLAVFFARRPGKWHYRLLAIGAILLFMVGVVRSGSRGGFLGLIAVAGTLLLTFRAVSKKLRIGVVIALFALLASTATDTYWGFIQTLAHPESDYNWAGKSKEGRVEIWKRGLGYMAKRPLLGVGPQNFPQAEGQLSEQAQYAKTMGRGQFKWSAAHNSFVQIGAELGIFGLIALLTLLYKTFKTLNPITRAKGPPGDQAAALAQVLRATMVGYIVTAFFLSQAYAAYLYITLGIVMGLAKLHRPPAIRPQIIGRRPSAAFGRPIA